MKLMLCVVAPLAGAVILHLFQEAYFPSQLNVGGCATATGEEEVRCCYYNIGFNQWGCIHQNYTFKLCDPTQEYINYYCCSPPGKTHPKRDQCQNTTLDKYGVN